MIVGDSFPSGQFVCTECVIPLTGRSCAAMRILQADDIREQITTKR